MSWFGWFENKEYYYCSCCNSWSFAQKWIRNDVGLRCPNCGVASTTKELKFNLSIQD